MSCYTRTTLHACPSARQCISGLDTKSAYAAQIKANSILELDT